MSIPGLCRECGHAKGYSCKTRGCPNNDAEAAAENQRQAVADAVEAERARIVAWLRTLDDPKKCQGVCWSCAQKLAERIERGDD
jgi:hypothetical protein